MFYLPVKWGLNKLQVSPTACASITDVPLYMFYKLIKMQAVWAREA